MHKYIILFFSVLTLLCSCKGGDTPPDGILDTEEMINVLIDVHTVDGSMVMYSQMQDTLYKYGLLRYSMIFQKDHTDSSQFRKSFKYYTLRPAVFSNMYTTVLKRLQKKTDSLTKLLTIQNKNKSPVPPSTGGRVPVQPVSPGQPIPAKPGMMMNPNQAAITKFSAKRDSILKQRLKEQNALPKK
ncbi:DUF4296 domain-containing protein [Mucilaginibacter sp.]